MRGRWMLAVAMMPLLLATQCVSFIDVRVAEERPGEPPSFTFAHDKEPLSVLQSFQVTECGGGREARMWRLVPDGRTQHVGRPLRITYGILPVGYEEHVGPRPLQPGGCYRVEAQGIGLPRLGVGWETFRILPTGTLLLGEAGGLINSSGAFRQLNRAAVGCARGYRRARTPGDSAAVAAREYRVMDARLSCEWLQDHWPDTINEPIATERALLVTIGGIAAIAGIIFLGEQIPTPEP